MRLLHVHHADDLSRFAVDCLDETQDLGSAARFRIGAERRQAPHELCLNQGPSRQRGLGEGPVKQPFAVQTSAATDNHARLGYAVVVAVEQ